jgi:hypothetical protein
MSNLNSLLGAQWVVAFLLFVLAGMRIVSGLVDPLRNKPKDPRELLTEFSIRYRLVTALAVLTTAALFLDIARLRYHWHVLWMEPNATTSWEFMWRCVWLGSVAWWVCEQYWPVIQQTYHEIRKAVRSGRASL